ncbi:unnamed protein product, partial [Urochloa humidicola]
CLGRLSVHGSVPLYHPPHPLPSTASLLFHSFLLTFVASLSPLRSLLPRAGQLWVVVRMHKPCQRCPTSLML